MNQEARAYSALQGTARQASNTAASMGATSHELNAIGSIELSRAIADVKGQAQFLLYLADQVEDCLGQLAGETDTGNAAFLCKLMSMYASQLETKHQGLGERIAETCQEVYAVVRELDLDE